MDRYKITIYDTVNLDQAGYHTRSKVIIFDNKLGQTFTRMGDGHQIGNFHPIYVNWRGSKIPIEELSKIQMTSKIYKIPLIWSMTNTLDVEAASPTGALLGILDEGIPHEDSDYVNYSLKIPISEFKKLNSLTDEEIESLRKNKSWGSILLED